ncbi:MAG: hypothetical protein PGN11_21130 [Quadrisphaera sp.]
MARSAVAHCATATRSASRVRAGASAMRIASIASVVNTAHASIAHAVRPSSRPMVMAVIMPSARYRWVR